MSLLTGHQLGPYEILSRLGAGGMGEVYKVRDAAMGKKLALDSAGRACRYALVVATELWPSVA